MTLPEFHTRPLTLAEHLTLLELAKTQDGRRDAADYWPLRLELMQQRLTMQDAWALDQALAQSIIEGVRLSQLASQTHQRTADPSEAQAGETD